MHCCGLLVAAILFAAEASRKRSFFNRC